MDHNVNEAFPYLIRVIFLTPSFSESLPDRVDDEVSHEAEKSQKHSSYPPPEPSYPVEGLSQFVGVLIHSTRRRQIRRAETREQQSQEQIQDLKEGEKYFEQPKTLWAQKQNPPLREENLPQDFQ